MQLYGKTQKNVYVCYTTECNGIQYVGSQLECTQLYEYTDKKLQQTHKQMAIKQNSRTTTIKEMRTVSCNRHKNKEKV